MAPSSLIDQTIEFVGALCNAGMPVSLAESLDATRAMSKVPLLDREALRAGFAATMCKRPAHRLAFDTLFDLYFPPAIGEGVRQAGDGASSGGDPEPYTRDPLDRQELRDALLDLLLEGDDEMLRRFAREMVSRLGRADTQPGRQSWFTYKVLRELNPETLMASLLDEVLKGQERGGLAEKVARQMLTERIKSFESYVEAEVRRRLAEEKGAERIARTAVKPLTEQVDFLRDAQ